MPVWALFCLRKRLRAMRRKMDKLCCAGKPWLLMCAFHSSRTVCLDDGSLAFSCVSWTRVYERLRAYTRVCVMSENRFMKIVRWRVIRVSLVRVGAYDIKLEMYKSCMSGDMAGGVLAGIWRKKRKWRKSRVKAGEIFMRSLLSLRFCIILSVSEVCSRFRQSFKESQFRQTHAGQLALRGWARVWTAQVGLSRVRAGSLPRLGLCA